MRNFIIEKVHLLHKNVNMLLKDLVVLNYYEITGKKETYTVIDTNKYG